MLATVAVVAIAVAILFVSGAVAATWTIQIADPSVSVGQDTSLEFDAYGNPRISYYDYANRDLKLASWNGSTWDLERVDAGGRVGKDTSIDASGHIAISYYDESNGNLKFARKNGSWQISTVDTGAFAGGTSDAGEYTSLEIDDQGRAHITYYNDTYDDLKYAVQVDAGTGNCGDGNSWQCVSIDSAGNVGMFTSLELDSAGKAHVSYYDATNFDLKYAVEVEEGVTGNCDDGLWQCTVIDTPEGVPPTSVGKYSSLALDEFDKAHISYFDEGSTSLKYAVEVGEGITGNCDAGQWQCTTVDNSANVGSYTSIAVDENGPPRISYFDDSGDNLKFAIQLENGSWQVEMVDSSGFVGQDTSLALRENGEACISYYGNSNLKLACQGQIPPSVTDLAPTGWLNTSSTTLSANYGDDVGINLDFVEVTLDGAPVAGCTVGANSVSCPVTGLTEGSHTYSVSVRDTSGLSASADESFQVDTLPPEIEYVRPEDDTILTSAIISIRYSYDNAGVDQYAISVTLDGAPVNSCVLSEGSINCPVSGLTPGVHLIEGSITDDAGNSAQIFGAFGVVFPPPPPPPPGTTVSPHGGYGTSSAPEGAQTDLCLSCHDIHQAEGDYALMREATVTETCGTCHALFGIPTGEFPSWTEAPIDLVDGDTGEASVSPTAAYENSGAARASGHRLGVSLDVNSNVSDVIPASTMTLRVMDSAAYDEGNIYASESVLEFEATQGLYCASCHTPHGTLDGVDVDGNGVDDTPDPANIYGTGGVIASQAYFGDQLVVDDSASDHPKHVKAQKLLSSNPNHASSRSTKSESYTDVNGNGQWDTGEPLEDTLIANGLRDSFMTPDDVPVSYNDWCLSCHDRQWNGTEWEGTELHGVPGVNNHPPLCVSCHSASGGNKGAKDFPHTSGNVKLLSKDHDGICLGCHSSGRLP